MADAAAASAPPSARPTVAGGPGTSAAPTRHRPRGLLIAGVAGLALFVLFAFAVVADVEHPLTQPLDDAWRSAFGSGPGVGQASWAVPMFFQYLGELPGAVLTILLIPAWLFIVGRWRSALFFLSAEFGGSLVVSQLTKNLVDRPRPAEDLANGLFGPLFSVDHGSFPSGHAVSAGILLVAVAALLPAAKRNVWWSVGGAIAVGMIWQRTLINAHWFSDAVFGIVGGASATLVLWWAFAPLLRADYGKPLFRRRITSPAHEGAS
ncbi:phosphatase PAP2 family protein [Agromyces subbeticus]|uniref:phosphatase PAP2 family protein n=1 Tax=Agromyces subbeticus TaxID=293890 RepID=UPI0003B5F42C|nr:phosphatase PAP2 family protein [Agromyces subbeticus]